MLPRVIIHNAVSLDGSTTGFSPDFGTHYGIVMDYRPDVLLVGSKTAVTGIPRVPAERKSDFLKPEPLPGDARPLWAIPDTRGILRNRLHVYRRFEYCRDVVVLVSKKTPKTYLAYLKDRNYDFLVAGEDRVNYRRALEMLAKHYQAKTVLTDSGGTLNSILLEKGLVNEISLLISPVLIGTGGMNLFRTLHQKSKGKGIRLSLLQAAPVDKYLVLLRYRIAK